jgi:hypothetical protein
VPVVPVVPVVPEELPPMLLPVLPPLPPLPVCADGAPAINNTAAVVIRIRTIFIS